MLWYKSFFQARADTCANTGINTYSAKCVGFEIEATRVTTSPSCFNCFRCNTCSVQIAFGFR